MTTWLITGVPVNEPYPCRCRRGRCRGPQDTDHPAYWCPCYGRTDGLDTLPDWCCAWQWLANQADLPTDRPPTDAAATFIPPPRREAQPCGLCGSQNARPYLCGWRCDEHSPAAMRGVPHG
jgi:hypothetical protein